MINNKELIKDLLKFEKAGDFYFIQVLARRKDNPGQDKDVKVIEDFYIYSFEDLEKHFPNIVELCNQNNARAYIRLNVRNDHKIRLQIMKRITDMVIEGNLKPIREIVDYIKETHEDDFFNNNNIDFLILEEVAKSIRYGEKHVFKRVLPSVAGEFHSDQDNKWILDVDWADFPADMLDSCLKKMDELVIELQRETKKAPLLFKIPTKNGVHYIVRPFNLIKFRDYFPQTAVQKDNPTILYIP